MLIRPYRVIVIARDPLARAGLATMLADMEEIDVVTRLPESAAFAVGERPLEHAPDADVAVWDLGWESSVDLRAALSETDGAPWPMLLLVAGDAQGVEAIQGGARGVLPRDADGPTLVSAIAAVANGLMVLSPSYATALREPEIERMSPSEELTPRELDVVRLLAEGLANKQIAERLGISEHTVKFHVNAILGKLGAHSRTEAVTRAARGGLIML